MADVFVSYAQGDRDWVKEFATALEGEGFAVWWDPNLLPGSKFRDRISHELEGAKAVIVVWSHLSVDSDWVRDEAEDARLASKLIPVLKEPVTPPHGFRQIQTANLSQWRGRRENPEFRRVVDAVRALCRPLPGTESPPAPPPKPVVEKTVVPPAPVPAATGVIPSLWRKGVLPGALALLGVIVLIGIFVYRGAQNAQSTDTTLEPPTSTIAAPAALNSNVADAVAKADQAATDAQAKATDAAAVSDKADQAANQARQAAETAKTTTSGYANGDVGKNDQGLSTLYGGQVNAQGYYDGSGVMTWSNGERYEGDWQAGHENGLGVHTSNTGDVYSGQFLQDKEIGIGKDTWKNGDTYEGEGTNEALQGLGVYVFKSGEIKAGNFAGSDLEGFAVYTAADGSTWKGSWHAGALNGYAAKFDAHGAVTEEGLYEQGTLKQALTP
jgi:hypothetical protein